MNTVKKLFFAAALIAVAGPARAADEWTAFSNMNEVRSIAFEGDRVWCATMGGAFCLDPASDRIEKYTCGENGLLSNRLYSVAVDRNTGDKWFTTMENGVSRLAGSTWTSIFYCSGFNETGVKAAYVDDSDAKWFLTDKNLWILKGTTWNFVHHPGEISRFEPGSLIQAHDGVFWMATAGILMSYDGTAVKRWTVADGYPGGYANAVAEDESGLIWVGTGSGAYSFDGLSWMQYTTADGLASNAVHAVAVDRDHVLWFGTDAGVSRFDGTSWKSYAVSDGLADPMVWSVAVDADNNKWFGTGNGLSRFDGVSWKSWIQPLGPGPDELIVLTRGKESWFAFGKGVYRFDGNAWTLFKTLDAYVAELAVNTDGVLWAGTNNGVSAWDGVSWKHYSTADGLVHERVQAVLAGRNGVMWFGTQSGISRFDGVSWTSYKAPNGPPHNDINVIAEDRDGLVWFGTENGACSFDGTTWKAYGELDGLGSRYVYSIAVDADNNKWFGGIEVSRFDGTNWTLYTKENSPISAGARCIAVGPDNVIWFGGDRIHDFVNKDVFGLDGPVSFDGTNWKVHPLPVDTDAPIMPRRLGFDSRGDLWVSTQLGQFRLSSDNVTPNIVAESAPSAFAISGNHPNPFNPSTTITFTLSESGPAMLSIYNVTGQKVRELVNAPLTAGTHSVVWDGRDMNGQPVSSGIYFSRLTRNGRSVAARMTLMK